MANSYPIDNTGIDDQIKPKSGYPRLGLGGKLY